jgi:signal transduction histidine kinase
MGVTDRNAAVYLTVSVIYLLLMGAVWWRRERRPNSARLMLAYILLLFLWSAWQALLRLGWLPPLVDVLYAEIPLYGILVLSIVLFYLSSAVLNASDLGLRWLILGAFWFVGLVLFDLVLAPRISALQIGVVTIEPWMLSLAIAFVGWIIFFGAALWLCFQTLRSPSRYQTIASYWGIVLLLILIGETIFFINRSAIGVLFHLFGLSLAAYVVSVRRIHHASHYARRLLSFLVFTSVAIVVFSISIIVGQLVFQTVLALNLVTMAVFIGLIFSILIYPLLVGMRKEIERWIAGDDQDVSYLLRQYSQRITNVLELKLLANVAVGTASEFLDVNRGYLFLVDREKTDDNQIRYKLRGVKGVGDTNPQLGLLSGESPLISFILENHVPITQSEIDNHTRFRKMFVQERTWLNSIGAEVFVPIYAKNEWIGLMALGPKTNGRSYTDQDLDLLSMMADQTAVALENTRLVDGLVRLNQDFRRAYAALDHANRHLERLDRTKSDFINIASHELRTPLTLIRGSSQMLLDDPGLLENPYYQQLLSKIDIGTDRLQEIVNSLLDVAKIDTRALELEPQPIRVNGLIMSVYDELYESIDGRNITVDVHGIDDLPPVSADSSALRKVFHHLIINAIKYTPDGGTITITGRRLEPDSKSLPHGGVEIIVSDTGIGIDPRYHELIFGKFYQTGELAMHSSGKTKFKGGGPGLGLTIARGVVEAHQGRIWVESSGYNEKKCPGSKFFVVLPIRQNTPEKIPTSSATFEGLLS